MKLGGAIVALMLALPTVAAAQEAAPAPSETLPPIPASPPAEPATQTAPVASSQASYFPALPPSRSCTGRDLIGMWKLQQLYESPAGETLRDFATYPFQYILFDRDTTFRAIRSTGKPQGNMQAVARKVYQEGKLQQYVMHNSGIVFFYENSVSVDSQACFIVANPQDQFTPGMMLLMPPAPADGSMPATRLVKIYTKIWVPAKPGQQPPKKKSTRHYRRAQ